jgi:hypothetical protein
MGTAGLCVFVSAGAFGANAEKFAVCHAPPDNPANIMRILVGGGGDAVASHLGHGDWLVSEEVCDAIPDNDCDGVANPLADNADCAARLGVGATCAAGNCEPPAADTPIGTITADILRGGLPPGSDRGVESPAVNLVADAQLWATSSNGAQIAFMNPGGVRSDLRYAESAGEGDGVVTYGEAFTFQPFGNTLITLPMTGAQIASVLAEQCQPAGSSRPFLHLGVSDGFTYDLAKNIVAGVCVSSAVSNVMLHGVPLDWAATYMVTVNNFLADGGDNFPTFATIDPSTRIVGGKDLAALVNYLFVFSPVSPPPTNRVNELP